MADDTMEITSDMGQEDIDIDLDLAPDHQDEDHVLDDAKSDTGLDDDYEIQLLSPPVQLHDDLMVDEDNPSFPMDDIPDGFPEAETIDIFEMTSVNQGAIVFNDNYDQNSTLFTTETNGLTETDWEQEQEQPHVETYINTHAENGSEQDTTQDSADNQKNLKDPRQSSISQPRLSTERTSSADVLLRDAQSQQREFAPKSYTDPQPEDTLGADEADVPKFQVQDVESADLAYTENSEPDVAAARGVIVVYRGVEYALVPSSKDDDPDSYFLEDDLLTREPISELLAALREVIIDDIAADQELCLTVNAFDIEISETSTSILQVTLGRIIELHTNLLRNDGIDMPGPMYISLGCKPDFNKRLGDLVAGASAGKGLSELISWDERSYSQEEESSGFVSGSAVHSEDEIPGSFDTMTRALSPQNGAEETRKTLQDPEKGLTSIEHLHNDNPTDDIHGSTRGGTSATKTRHVEEEEEVLIDYEDDEDGHIPQSPYVVDDQTYDHNGIHTDLICIKPQTCFCAVCNEVLIAEYESINKDLKRRSLSRVAEDIDANALSVIEKDGAVNSTTDQERLVKAGRLPEDISGHEDVLDATDEYSYHEEQFDLLEYDEARDPENQDVSDKEDQHDHSDKQYNEHDGAPSFSKLTGPEVGFEQSFEPEDRKTRELDVEEDIDFEIRPQGEEYDKASTNALKLDRSVVNLDEINYEELDEPPQSNESDQTIGHDGLESAPYNDIDYEDDAEPTLKEDLEPEARTNIAPVSKGVTNKRSRGADGQDAFDGQSKDAKRVRS